jgi:hypothetical protein
MSRKISLNATNAFYRGENFTESNTAVRDCGTYVGLYLWGNRIASYEKTDRHVWFSLCGYNTNTTRERLRALGIDIKTRNGRAYYNGAEIDINGVHESDIIA